MQSLIPDLFITNYFDCIESKALSKNYLLWVYYEKNRLTP